MASCNQGFPLITEDDDDNSHRHQTFASHCATADKFTGAGNSAEFYSQNADANSFADAGDESSDQNRPETTTRNGKRNSNHHKKPKHGGAAADSSGEFRVDHRKDREEWSDSAIAFLLDAYTEKYLQLNRSNLRGRDWEVVAEIVNERCDTQKSCKSMEQCKNKIDNLKKRYKVEFQRMNGGGLMASNWPWFKKMEVIVGNSVSIKSVSDEDKSGGGNSASVIRQSKSKSKSMPALKWRRVVFKISGVALSRNSQSVDPKVALQIAREIATACRVGVEVAIVVGGRNFFCGDSWVSATGLDRPTAYQIGMMATVMNSVLLQSALEKLGFQTRVQSAFPMPEVAEPYNRLRAIRHLEKGRIVIFGGIGAGVGNPLFTTDTAAALRASEINADAVLKGTNVNGIYDCQSVDNNAVLDHMSFREVVSRGITSMDMMAIQYCQENGIPVVVFNLLEPGNISRALCGDQVGTLIDQAGRIS
ncbi:uridylate kinase PUMPKIN, chloroplastic-like isoform X2 [Cornus florida]|uniref:uridylate kinase PUMPKIN, chloroplastic-like isoform X2 n=1 Tax=Cornus florida TaxID=4283 RepID=UPI002898827D|nr:uridylate kinase PUMPKIN, chloroplastic-like isoform X2 [Cornus florida]